MKLIFEGTKFDIPLNNERVKVLDTDMLQVPIKDIVESIIIKQSGDPNLGDPLCVIITRKDLEFLWEKMNKS